MARPSQSSLLLFLALAGGVMVVLVPLCDTRPGPTAPHSVTMVAEPAPVDLSELENIERDPIVIPDSGLADARGDWVIPGDQPSLTLPSGQTPPPPVPAAAAPAALPTAPGDGGEPDAVAAYLREVEFALTTGKYWSNPNEFAQTLMMEMTTGQTGGLTTLRESNAAVLARLQAIAPPPGCEAHHRETVATVAASVELLQTWETMLETGDLAGFASMAGEAEALRTRAERVEAMGEALKSGR